jgi:hypothetical protein
MTMKCTKNIWPGTIEIELAKHIFTCQIVFNLSSTFKIRSKSQFYPSRILSYKLRGLEMSHPHQLQTLESEFTRSSENTISRKTCKATQNSTSQVAQHEVKASSGKQRMA